MNLLFLDFDDCIINWDLNSENRLKELKFNLQCIRDFCVNNKYKIAITSSWSKMFYPNSLKLKNKYNNLPNHEKEIIKILNYYIKDLVIYTDPYDNRVKFIKELAKANNNNIHIVLDDFPLPELTKISNVIYLQTINGIMYKYKGNMLGNLLKLEKIVKRYINGL